MQVNSSNGTNKYSIKTNNKINVYFFLSTSLLNGRGFERTTISFAKHMDLERFNVTIIHSNSIFFKRIEQSELDALPKGINIVQFNGKLNNLRKINWIIRKIFPLGKLIEMCISAPIIFHLTSKKLLKSELEKIEENDIVYLVDPVDLSLFSGTKAKLVGSNQGLFENPDALYTRLIVHLVGAGILLKKINYFHLFPMNEYLNELWLNKICEIIPLGTETNLFRDKSEYNGNAVRFLFIGALEKFKGILDAISAFTMIDKTYPLEFHIGGGGSLGDYVEEMSKKDRRIVYHGIVSEEEKINLYQTCDVFVYPSLGETFGIVVTEALASGLFVILGNRLSGNFREPFEMGYLSYCSYEPLSIKKELLNAVKNIEKIRSMRQEIKTFAAKLYDWSPITEKLMQFFEEIANFEN